MDLKLAGKTALITGGSKGIGRATAEILAAEGCNVIIVSRTAETLAAVKSAIAQKSNVRVDTVVADLSDSKNVDRLAKDFPDIDILVNNAGAIPGGTLLNVDEATWRRAWDLKVFGYVNMCRAFYALMKARGSGVIINVVGNAADTHDPVRAFLPGAESVIATQIYMFVAPGLYRHERRAFLPYLVATPIFFALSPAGDSPSR